MPARKLLALVFFWASLAAFIPSATAQAQLRDLAAYPGKLNAQAISIKVYLPSGYAAGQDHYPVVYHLHGGGGAPQRQWDRTRATLTRATSERLVTPPQRVAWLHPCVVSEREAVIRPRTPNAAALPNRRNTYLRNAVSQRRAARWSHLSRSQ